jgi:hypothetical protein
MRRIAPERYRLPEVGDLMKRVARIHEIGRLACVLVRKEPRLHRLEIAQIQPLNFPTQARQHRGRNVDGNDSTAIWGCGQRESAGPSAQIDEQAFLFQAEFT